MNARKISSWPAALLRTETGLSSAALALVMLLATAVTGCGSPPAATAGSGGSGNANSGGTGSTPGAADSAGGTVTPTPGSSGSTSALAVAPGGKGLITLAMNGCVGAEYYAGVNLGDDHLNLILDSGSTTLAAASSACKTCNTKAMYDGSTGTSQRTQTSGLYGDESTWTGTIYADNVDMGPLAAPLTPEVQVKFAAITSQQNFFLSPPNCVRGVTMENDGIVGLGPDTLLLAGTTSLLTGLYATGKLANDAFSMQACEVGGNLMLGGYASNSVASDPVWVPMVSTGALGNYYSVSVTQMLLGNTDTGVTSRQLGSVLVDTGTNYTPMPSALYRPFVALLEKTTDFNVENYENGDCLVVDKGTTRAQVDAELPKLQLVMAQADGTTATMTFDASRSYLIPFQVDANTVYYCPSVYEDTDKNAIFILGNSFMRQHVFIFDRAGRRIGMAPQQGCPDALSYGGN